MTMMPTFLAGANWVMHSAGWLEGGLVAGYEKFIVDVELLQMLQAEFTPLEIDEDSLAFDAHEEVGHGGHFLGAMHTMERFRTCFYRPMLSSSENYERWMRNGGQGHRRPRHQDLPEEARGVRAARPRRRHPPAARGVRRPPQGGARDDLALPPCHHSACRACHTGGVARTCDGREPSGLGCSDVHQPRFAVRLGPQGHAVVHAGQARDHPRGRVAPTRRRLAVSRRRPALSADLRRPRGPRRRSPARTGAASKSAGRSAGQLLGEWVVRIADPGAAPTLSRYVVRQSVTKCDRSPAAARGSRTLARNHLPEGPFNRAAPTSPHAGSKYLCRHSAHARVGVEAVPEDFGLIVHRECPDLASPCPWAEPSARGLLTGRRRPKMTFAWLWLFSAPHAATGASERKTALIPHGVPHV